MLKKLKEQVKLTRIVKNVFNFSGGIKYYKSRENFPGRKNISKKKKSQRSILGATTAKVTSASYRTCT